MIVRNLSLATVKVVDGAGQAAAALTIDANSAMTTTPVLQATGATMTAALADALDQQHNGNLNFLAYFFRMAFLAFVGFFIHTYLESFAIEELKLRRSHAVHASCTSCAALLLQLVCGFVPLFVWFMQCLFSMLLVFGKSRREKCTSAADAPGVASFLFTFLIN